MTRQTFAQMSDDDALKLSADIYDGMLSKPTSPQSKFSGSFVAETELSAAPGAVEEIRDQANTKHDFTPDRVETLRQMLDDAASRIGRQHQRIAALEELLLRCAEFIEPYSDVSDGAYGEPVPNAAMALLSDIKEEIT